MFSMTRGVPLLTVELKDPRYIVKLEVKMLDMTLHLNIMIHAQIYVVHDLRMVIQRILGSNTQTKENMKSLIFLPPKGGRGVICPIIIAIVLFSGSFRSSNCT